MLRKTASGTTLILLLTSVFLLASNIQPVITKSEDFDLETLSDDSRANEYDLADVRHRFATFSNETLHGMDGWNYSDGVVVGINDKQLNAYNDLAFLISKNEGNITSTVSIGEKVIAVIAKLPHHLISTAMTTIEDKHLSKYIEPNVRFQADFVPNDPDWPLQWGSSKIEADWAWNTMMGDPSILVAVVDSGVDWNHPDLADNYVALGYDWVNDDSDPMDDHGHGTHCAGIIAALTNNGIGIAGTAQVKIMAEKGLDASGSGYSSWLANSIIHAVDQGANIISMSWGSFFDSELICDAIKYAYNAGVLLVAAAGNDAWSLRQYPAVYDEVVAVTATDSLDNPASFTNFGDWVELAAPGVHIYSTLRNNKYGYMSGTSMSTPYVCGVAALIWSRFPTMARDQVRVQLRRTADDLGDQGFDEYFGYGRINARNAVENFLPNHDLLILKLNMTTYVEPGDLMSANVTILNFGESNESSIEVQLLVDGDIKESSLISNLPSGASAEISFSCAPMIEGTHNVTLYLLPVLDEENVENNVLSKRMLVRVEKVIRVPADYLTIKQAVDVASSGFNIYVASGLYNEHLVIYESLRLVGEQANTTFIDGNGVDALIVFSTVDFNISGFTIQNGRWGVLLWMVSNVTMDSNKILDNDFGINLKHCGNNTLRNNDISGNVFNFGVEGNSLPDFVNYVDSSNTVDRKRIYYWVNQHDKQVPVDAGYVAIVNSTRITVRGLSLTGNYRGVLFAYTNNSTIKNVKSSNNHIGVQLWCSTSNALSNITASDCYVGIDLSYSNENILDDSFASDCLLGGFSLSESNNNSLNSNIASDCFFGGIILFESNNLNLNSNIASDCIFGIGLLGSSNSIVYGSMIADTSVVGVAIEHYGNNNTITHNMIMSSSRGISLLSSSNNIVSDNTILDNSYGILIGGSSDNIFFHNNFINNKIQVLSDNSENMWDDGYPSGGNYWTDYTRQVGWHYCTDDYCGPHQNETGFDGIWDHPYVIGENNTDSYPLVHPWGLIPGDVNVDGKVDIHDAVSLLSAYGSTLEDANWNPIADIAPPWGRIDLYDAATMCYHYGQKHP